MKMKINTEKISDAVFYSVERIVVFAINKQRKKMLKL